MLAALCKTGGCAGAAHRRCAGGETRLRQPFSGRPAAGSAAAPSAASHVASHQRQRPLAAASSSVLDDDSLSIADLEAQLRSALAVEDYTLAAGLRDAIQQRQSVGKLAVEEANRKFYAAFMSGRIEAMESIIGQGEHVQVVHPGSNCIAGREQVMESWRAILKNVRPNAFKVTLEDVRVYASDTAGFVTCIEVIDADDSVGRIVATNIFEKQAGAWVLVQHHGSPSVGRFR